jgi:hypothetical protein
LDLLVILVVEMIDLAGTVAETSSIDIVAVAAVSASTLLAAVIAAEDAAPVLLLSSNGKLII